MKVYVVVTSQYDSDWIGSKDNVVAVVKDEERAKHLCELYKETINQWDYTNTYYEEFEVEE